MSKNVDLLKNAAVKYFLGETQKIKPGFEKSHPHPLMDNFPHGIPLGGFGAGTIGRTSEGDFSVWHLYAGRNIYENLPGCAFHYYEKNAEKTVAAVLSGTKAKKGILKDWKYFPQDVDPSSHSHAGYKAKTGFLYPQTFIDYRHPDSKVELNCRQFSPIIPNNYKETSYPVAVFEYELVNKSLEPVESAIAFSFENIFSWDVTWPNAPHNSESCFFTKTKAAQVHKVQKNKKTLGLTLSNKGRIGELTLATANDTHSEISVHEYFDPRSKGTSLWKTFSTAGTLKKSKKFSGKKSFAAGAISVKVKLNPGERKIIPFTLTWDLPKHELKKGENFYRYYTKFLGKAGNSSFKLANIALTEYPKWLKQIEEWQISVIGQNKFPSWLYGMMFNELYYVADGGTVWDAKSGDFGSLECFDYFFYETLDVRYYGSFPLLRFWPKLEKNVMNQFGKTVLQEDLTHRRYWKYNWMTDLEITEKPVEMYAGPIKLKGSVPHDLGSLQGAPLRVSNGYIWRNVNYWKDLNAKFVLLIYRAYLFDTERSGVKDKSFIQKNWKAVVAALDYLKTMDRDNDGMIENDGFPDQTYDNWPMSGVSAYCGTLWLAALSAATKMSKIVGDGKSSRKFNAWYKQGGKVFIKKLWNGKYFDCYEGNTDVLSDQLNGQWYCDILNLPPLFDRKKIKSALETIYKNNVLGFANGFRGVANGKTKEGKSCGHEQGDDAWVGTSFSVAKLMMDNDMKNQAFQILAGLFKTIYHEKGYFFRTPEGWDERGNFVGSMYMRPGAIWSLLD
jgi:non-lysosomal glucosylceramidase